MYGGRKATFRNEGVLNLPQSSSSRVTSKRPVSLSFNAPYVADPEVVKAMVAQERVVTSQWIERRVENIVAVYATASADEHFISIFFRPGQSALITTVQVAIEP